jgi:predicted DCC family thiol-disulfide oxidoreductase YuxK
MRFAPLQGPTASAIIRRHPELQGIDSLVLVQGGVYDEAVFTRSEAILRVGSYLGSLWALSRLLRVVPLPIRDWAYSFFARHRSSVFGRYDACPVPGQEVRHRFLP